MKAGMVLCVLAMGAIAAGCQEDSNGGTSNGGFSGVPRPPLFSQTYYNGCKAAHPNGSSARQNCQNEVTCNTQACNAECGRLHPGPANAPAYNACTRPCGDYFQRAYSACAGYR